MGRSPIASRVKPRITANDLALYMVSSDTARMGIIRRSRDPQVPPLIRYRDARNAIVAYLSDPRRPVNPLISAEDMLKQRIDDPASSTLKVDDARHSIDVLHAVQKMRNQLGGFDFIRAPRQQSPLNISGVDVSVRADLLVHGTARGTDQIGVAVLRMTVDDAESDTAIKKRQNMGLYVATLARSHLDRNIQSNRSPANRLCMSIDIQHGEVFPAPNSNARRANDIENACRMIAAIWDDA